MKRSQRRNTLQICPHRDSNSGGSDLWSNRVSVRQQNSGVHVFTSFYTIREVYIQLFISQTVPIIISSFVDLNITLIPVLVWKIVCQILQCLIGVIHPPEMVHIFQKKVANIWTNKWMFICAYAQISISENVFVCVSAFVLRTSYFIENFWPCYHSMLHHAIIHVQKYTFRKIICDH